MDKHIIQIPSRDGYVYVYDVDKQTLRKLCPIAKPEDISADVRETLYTCHLPVATDDARPEIARHV
jgi:hypothetical protein